MANPVELDLVGRAPEFLAALALVRRFAVCDVPVLIQGETGTGKELIARAIHYGSSRRNHPFVPVNCGAVPENLLENELFGHVKGAFTGATEQQRGLIAQAEGGSLLLDEIDSLSEKGQVALLRFLEDKRYKRLGAAGVTRADVRILAASNTDLFSLAHEQRFRSDLLYRLEVGAVPLPPLRERGEDVALLAEHFLERYRIRYEQPQKAFSEGFLAWMRAYTWPGNVRELDNVVHRQFLLADGTVVQRPARGSPRAAPAEPCEGRNALLEGSFQAAKERAIHEFEREYLRRVMRECGGNVTKAARKAGKERRALGKLLKKHNLTPTDWTGS